MRFFAGLFALILCLPMSAVWGIAAAPEESGEEGFRNLFNGTDLSGWDGDSRFWKVIDGVIDGETTAENPTEGNTFLIWRDGEVDDFELRLSYRMFSGNSGIQYRSKEVSKYVIGGYQADIDSDGTYTGILYDEKGRGILAQRGEQTEVDSSGKPTVNGSLGEAAELYQAVRPGEWNEYKVIASGHAFTHVINGVTMSQVIDNDPKDRDRAGLLALQLHAGPPMHIQFKDVRIKRLNLEDRKKVVLVSGKPSHGWGEHDFPAGIHALRKCLDNVPNVVAADYYEGWPKDPSAFDNADTILFYMDGGSGHPAIQGDRLQVLDALMKKGVGMACVHYAVEVPKDKGGPELKEWIGGYYETDYSINPHWVAEFKTIPKHPITRGVQPFKILDEWYYNMRFREGMKGVTPLLTGFPPDETRRTTDTKAHPGREEIVAWAATREDGGRGFGFTGGHFHSNWRDANFRKMVLNALLWTAGAQVPEGGVESNPSEEDLTVKLRPRPAGK